jgi:hypothetical protein
MSPGDVLLGAVVALLDGARFGLFVVGLAFGVGSTGGAEFHAVPGAAMVGTALFVGFGLVWLPLSAFSYYRFRTEQEYFPVVRTALGVYGRVRTAR